MFKWSTFSKTKRALVVAGILCAAGVVVAGIAFAATNFNFPHVVATPDYTEQNYTYSADHLNALKLDIENQRVEIAHSDDNQIHVDVWQNEGYQYNVKEGDGSLSIETKRYTNWYDQFLYGFFSSIKTYEYGLKVYIPKDYAGDLVVIGHNGSISMSDFKNLSKLEVASSNASVTLENVSSGSLKAQTSNSSLRLNTVVSGDTTVSNSNGSIRMDGMTVASLTASTSNSSLEGKNLAVENAASFSNSNGSLYLEAAQAQSMEANTSNSSTKLVGVEAATVIAGNQNGSISVSSLDSPFITLYTSNSSISGTIQGSQKDYAITASTTNSSNNLANVTGGSKVLNVTNSNGAINIGFTE